MNSFRKLVLLWMIFWLPVSGAMAAVMPISGMSATVYGLAFSNVPTNASEEKIGEALTDTVASSMPCHSALPATDSPDSGTCNHCVLCHLAVSLMLPSLPVVQGVVPPHNFSTTPLLSHTSFVPDLASPPPRTRQS